MKLLRYTLFALLLLTVGLPVITYVALDQMGTEKLKPYIIKAVKEQTGRTLTIDGDLSTTLGFSPRVTLQNIRLSNASWASSPDMVIIEEGTISLNLRSLITKRKIIIEDVTIKGMQLYLEASNDQQNWVFQSGNVDQRDNDKEDAPATDKKQSVTTEIQSVTLLDSAVFYTHNQQNHQLAIPEAAAKLHPKAHFHGVIGYNGADLRITMSSDATGVHELMQHDIATTLNISAPETSVQFNGIAAYPAIKGDITVKMQSAHHLSGVLPFVNNLPKTDPLQLAGNIDADLHKKSGSIHVQEGTYGTVSGSGKVKASFASAKPHIDADISIPRYALSPTTSPQPVATKNNPVSAPAQETKKEAAHLPLDMLNAFNANIRLMLDELVQDGTIVAKDITVASTIHKGVLSVDSYKAGIFGGTIEGNATVSGKKNYAHTMNLNANDVSVESIATYLKHNTIKQGNLQLETSLSSRGNTVSSITQRLEGTIAYVLGETHYQVPASARDIGNFLNLLRGKQTEGRTIAMHCSVGKWSVANQIASTDMTAIDTAGALIMVDGSVNLNDTTLALTLSPRPKQAGLSKLTIPINVKGTLKQPNFVPDTGGVLRTLGIAGLSLIKDDSGITRLLGTELSKHVKNNAMANCLQDIPEPATLSDLTTKEGLKQLKTDAKQDLKKIEKNFRSIRDDVKGLRNLF